MTPKLLFPFCYESHGFLFVELHDDRDLGGHVFEWAYAGSPFYRRFAGLSRLPRSARRLHSVHRLGAQRD